MNCGSFGCIICVGREWELGIRNLELGTGNWEVAPSGSLCEKRRPEFSRRAGSKKSLMSYIREKLLRIFLTDYAIPCVLWHREGKIGSGK